MADYKDIKGGTIQNFAGDPPAPIAGQVWYDSTAIAFQYMSSNPAGAWASGGILNTARSALGAVGIQTASLAFGGSPPPAPAAKDVTESYNGSAWSEVADLNTARAYPGSAGTATSAIAFGGDQYGGIAESWNGTSWTEVADTAQLRQGGASGGSSVNAYIGGGQPAAVSMYTCQEWTVPDATKTFTAS